MPTYLDHTATVDLLEATWAAIADLYAGLDDADWDRPTCLPGWTVRDQLTHIFSTEQMLSGVAAPDIDVSHLTHLRNDIARSNEAWVEARRATPGPEVLDEFRRVTAERIAVLRAMSQADFDAPSWTPAGPDETFGRFMRIRAFDSFMHEHDTRAAVGAPDREDPAAVRSALDEVATALGFIVGRRAALPDGSRVSIQLTGAVPTTYLVEITGRAQVVEELTGPPTVGLTLPAMLWLRLTGGRIDPATVVDTEVALEGDTDLARQLASNLGFTI